MHPLAAPGTLWVLSRVGKYLVRPQADETSHKEQISCARQGKGPILLFPYHKEFRLCGGDQRAFRSPPGPLRGPVFLAGGRNLPQTAVSLWQARKMPFLLFPACIKPSLKYNKKSPVRLTAPGSDCQKTFRRCRRGRSPSDFSSCKPALPASRVVDFACKINSLQIRATSG